MSTQEREKLIDKIKKLLAKASGTDNQQEAEMFMAKANELLIQHKLEMSEIGMEEEDGITHETNAFVIGEIVEEGTWEVQLITAIARHNMCEAIRHTITGVKVSKITLIGEKHSIEITKFMFETARDSFRRIAKATYNTKRKSAMIHYPDHSELELQKAKILPYRMPFIRSFLKGCAIGLNGKITEIIAQSVAQAGTQQSYELMIMNNNQLIAAYVGSLYNDVRTVAPKIKVEKSAFEAGRKVGQNHELTNGIDASQSTTKRLQ